MKQAAAIRRKGVVGRIGRKIPAVPRPTEMIPIVISSHLVNVAPAIFENRRGDSPSARAQAEG
jgi:hypothetical protein